VLDRLRPSRPTTPCVATRFNEGGPRYSPDGRWLAYESDETGINEIYDRPASCGGAKTQVSLGGGDSVVWAKDSRLFSSPGRLSGFDVMPGGRRFVALEGQPAPVPSQINLVLGGLLGVGRR
jgi:hypothetical protein